MNELISLYENHQGKVSDRWNAYLLQYDKLFAPWRDKPLRLLEIGIQNGGSLEIWAKYFPQAQVFVGCDIEPRCGSLSYDDPRISVVVGDASTDETQQRIDAISPEWDIVIEDASHQSRHIIDAFSRFFPRLVDGGLFIAEDLHCSYWQEYGGGLADPFSSIAFFKRLADLTNFEHWGVPVSRVDYLASFAAHYGCRFDEASLARIHSVEFFNSQCVIRARPAMDNELGARFIAGNDAQVYGTVKQLAGSRSQAIDQTRNGWSDPRLCEFADGDRYAVRVANLAQAVVQRDGQIASLSQSVAECDRLIEGLRQSAAERNAQIAHLNQALSEQSGQIAGLSQSVADRDGEIARLSQLLSERDARIANLDQAAAESSARIAESTRALQTSERAATEILNSRYWRWGRPVRWLLTRVKRLVPSAGP